MEFNKRAVAKFLAESNRIEGYVTNEQWYVQEMSNHKKKNKHVKNSVRAWEYVKDNHTKIPTTYDLLQLHRCQMLDLLQVKETGQFRRSTVMVGGHCPCNPASVPYKIDDLMYKIEDRQPMDAHFEFETIHPFVDGNGRVGRLLYLWLYLLQGNEFEGADNFLTNFLDLGEDPDEADFYALRQRYYGEIIKWRLRKEGSLV